MVHDNTLLDEIREIVTSPLLPTPALNAAYQIAPVQRTVKASVC